MLCFSTERHFPILSQSVSLCPVSLWYQQMVSISQYLKLSGIYSQTTKPAQSQPPLTDGLDSARNLCFPCVCSKKKIKCLWKACFLLTLFKSLRFRRETPYETLSILLHPISDPQKKRRMLFNHSVLGLCLLKITT